MRAVLPLALLLAVAACSKPAETAASKPKSEAKTKTDSDWVFGLGKNSVEMTHLLAGDTRDPDLRLLCARGQGFLLLAPRVTPIGSEERLSLGAGDKVKALVASPNGSGVQGVSPIDAELLAILSAKEPLSFSYGATNSEPYAPPPAVRQVFVESCRKLLASGEA